MLGSWLLPVALVVTACADQAVKALVLSSPRRPALVALGSAVRVHPVATRRTLAGHLGAGPALLAATWVACLAAAVVVAPRIGLLDGAVARVALGAALGGAAGNLVDLLARKRVVDYLEVGRWPACNLADVAIVSGVAVALLAA